MRNPKQQSGFAILELVLIVAVLAAAGFTAWWVYQRQQTTTASTAPSKTINTTATAQDVSSAPEVNSSDDLNSALKTIDQNDPSDTNSDTSQLDTEASGF